MCIDINIWINQYIDVVKAQFGERIWFIGLQGSYSRDEATESSDIDVVLILDKITANDLKFYDKTISSLSERDKICGFVSGKDELLAWEPSDLFQFYFDTKPIYGSLDKLKEKITADNIHTAIRIGACNIYHMCVHNLVHEKDSDTLKALYKSSVFTLQAIAYLQTESYLSKKDELMLYLLPDDKDILIAGIKLKQMTDISPDTFSQMSELLLNWASALIVQENTNLFIF